MIHAALGRVRRHKLSERSSKETLQYCDEDEAVDNRARTSSSNLGDET